MLFSPKIIPDIIIAHFLPFGPQTLAALRKRGLDASALLAADRLTLLHNCLSEKKVDAFLTWRKTCDQDALLRELEKHRICAIRDDEGAYPPLLTQTHAAPRVLFYQGTFRNDLSMVGLVGSREATSYGLEVARMLARGLVQARVGTVSGGARGIDEAVAQSALEGGGYTVAVLGSGLLAGDTGRSRDLTRAIIDGDGAVVSEFAPRVPPLPQHFPRRNRIIAGISKATVIIEGALKSGSLITARLALEENREVFAVPGPITSSYSEGTNALLRQGAQVCTKTRDILESLGIESPETSDLLPANTESSDPILRHLSSMPLSVDELVMCSGIAIHDLQVGLTALELEGKIVQAHGMVRIC